MSQEMLEKVITTSSIGNGENTGAIMSREHADHFLDRIWDATVLWKEAQFKKLNAPIFEWATVNVGARIVKKATEAVDDGENASANFTKVSMTTTKLRLDYEISTESLEDTIEGASIDDHLTKLFAWRFAENLEELAIHGDVNSSDQLLKSFDGWHKKALEGGRVVTAAGGTGNGQLSRKHFNQAIKAMPRQYVNRNSGLRFYASTGLIQDYLYSQSEMGIVPNEVIAAEGSLRNSPVPEGAAGFSTLKPFGIELKEVPLFDTNFSELNASTGMTANDSTSFMELTNPSNRLIGIQREVKVNREYVAKKDSLEYTIYVRLGIAWAELDQVVTVKDIPVLD